MTTIALWPTVLEALEALGECYTSAMDQAAAESGVSEWQGWLLPALWFEPEPVSATRMRLRSPYTSPRLYGQRLADAAERGFLTPVGPVGTGYRLTDAGRQAAMHIMDAMYAEMEALQPLPAGDLERLATLLHRLVLSSLAAPEPPGKWALRFSCRLDPAHGKPVVVRIDQYGGDLAAYRDDAHFAAWQPLGTEGHTWDVLTCLWRGEASTLADIHNRLQHRGFTLDEDRRALDDLIRRGWVREDDGRFAITAAGKVVRQEAEATTDRYFYAPWSCLSRFEAEDMRALLRRLHESLESATQGASNDDSR